MIPKDFIADWREHAPWELDLQVEQDLVISRALVEMFRIQDVADRLAFRGGTALYKLHLLPSARYSEDIDLVQLEPEAIGDTIDLIRGALDPWLGTPRRRFKRNLVSLIYRFESEDTPPEKMRLKIEINSREHFVESELTKIPFRMESRWFSGEAMITTFEVNELLGSKLRALYQRKKGRDLFDLRTALERGVIDLPLMLRCFDRCMKEGNYSATRAEFEANLHRKSDDSDFRNDMDPLLPSGSRWDFDEALAVVGDRIISALPGEPWKGPGDDDS